jgi:hypothetical protein
VHIFKTVHVLLILSIDSDLDHLYSVEMPELHLSIVVIVDRGQCRHHRKTEQNTPVNLANGEIRHKEGKLSCSQSSSLFGQL